MIARTLALLAASLLMLCAWNAAHAGRTVVVDRVKIAVNNKVLTAREVRSIKQLRIQELKSQYEGEALEHRLAELERTLQQQLIQDLLLESHAESLDIEISDRTIEQRVDAITRREPGIVEAYSDAQLKRFVLKELLRQRVLGREVESRIRVTDEEIVAACRKDVREDRELDVGHILVRGEEPQALRKIRALREKLEAGADFEALALAHSQDPSVQDNKGRLGFIRKGQFVEAFEEAAFSLDEGELSQPVKTRFGYHLIKVFAARTPERVNCDQLDAVARQSYRNQVRQRQRQKRLEQFFTRLRNEADIKVMN